MVGIHPADQHRHQDTATASQPAASQDHTLQHDTVDGIL